MLQEGYCRVCGLVIVSGAGVFEFIVLRSALSSWLIAEKISMKDWRKVGQRGFSVVSWECSLAKSRSICFTLSIEPLSLQLHVVCGTGEVAGLVVCRMGGAPPLRPRLPTSEEGGLRPRFIA